MRLLEKKGAAPELVEELPVTAVSRNQLIGDALEPKSTRTKALPAAAVSQDRPKRDALEFVKAAPFGWLGSLLSAADPEFVSAVRDGSRDHQSIKAV